jgi:CubicO group peptidase (beta-lactamase class C family)
MTTLFVNARGRRRRRPGESDVASISFERIWQVQDAHVASGHVAGYVAAVRLGARTEVHAGRRLALKSASPPMRDDTLFRIASLTKPMGGALTLSLVQDCNRTQAAGAGRRG